MLVRCLYASHPAKPAPANLLDQILVQSRGSNPRRGITGLLCHTPEVFVQVLEGGRDEVSTLFTTIVCDSRHEDVRLLVYEEIGARRFNAWSMGQVNLGSVNAALLLKYFPRATLDPFQTSGHATMAFLLDLVESGAISSRGST